VNGEREPTVRRFATGEMHAKVSLAVLTFGPCLSLSCMSYDRIKPDGSQPLLFDGLQNTLHAVFSK
jgi:hypothetical protein